MEDVDMEKIQLMNVQRQHEAHAAEYEDAVIEVLRSGQYIGCLLYTSDAADD